MSMSIQDPGSVPAMLLKNNARNARVRPNCLWAVEREQETAISGRVLTPKVFTSITYIDYQL